MVRRTLARAGIFLLCLLLGPAAAHAKDDARVLGVKLERTSKEDALAIRTESASPKYRVRESRGLQYFSVDIEDAILGDAPKTQAFPDLPNVQGIEFSQAENPPHGVVRVIVRFKKWTDYKVQARDGAIYIVLPPSGSSGASPALAASPVAPPAEIAALPAPVNAKPASPAASSPMPAKAGVESIASMQASVAKTGDARKADGKALPAISEPRILSEFASSGQPSSSTPRTMGAGEPGARIANVSASNAGGSMGSMTNGVTSVESPTDFGGAGVRRMDKPEDFGLRGGAYDMIVDLDFRDQRVEDVIRLLAAKGQINVLMDPKDVSGNVTLHLAGVPLGVALDNILHVNGLGYVQETNNILRVVKAKQLGTKDVETSTEHIVLNWVKSTALATTLRPFISNEGQIQANAENNSIIVTDTPPNLGIIRNLVAELDVPEKQVEIEMHLVDVAEFYSKSHDVRVSLTDPKDGDNGVVVGGDGITFDEDDNSVSTFDFGLLTRAGTTGLLGQTLDYTLAVSADAGNTHNEVLANPKVITLNNLEAKIDIIENIPFLQGNLPSGSSNAIAQIEFEEAGEMITVTPTITANGYIRMVINVEQRIFRRRAGSGSLDPPVIDERTATTNVIVRDGSMITLGGLEGHRMLDQRSGIPWFMDIPVFRWFFQSKSNSIDRTTLYLFVKPKIVPVDASELSEREKFWYDNVDRNWELPGRFFDDFSGYWDKYPAP